jgi:Family of unknown function (DUF6176)
MIHVAVHRVRPDQVARLEAWFGEAGRRADEVRRTLHDEGVTHEQAHLITTGDGPLLVYTVESDDYDAARRVFQRSVHAIDAEHKAVMAEVLDGEADARLLFDIQR